MRKFPILILSSFIMKQTLNKITYHAQKRRGKIVEMSESGWRGLNVDYRGLKMHIAQKKHKLPVQLKWPRKPVGWD